MVSTLGKGAERTPGGTTHRGVNSQKELHALHRWRHLRPGCRVRAAPLALPQATAAGHSVHDLERDSPRTINH